MTAYTIIAGQLVKIGVTATGARYISRLVRQNFPVATNEQDFERLRVAKLEVK